MTSGIGTVLILKESCLLGDNNIIIHALAGGTATHMTTNHKRGSRSERKERNVIVIQCDEVFGATG
jgi:hypothetical protein